MTKRAIPLGCVVDSDTVYVSFASEALLTLILLDKLAIAR